MKKLLVHIQSGGVPSLLDDRSKVKRIAGHLQERVVEQVSGLRTRINLLVETFGVEIIQLVAPGNSILKRRDSLMCENAGTKRKK